jgi:hypothetical protein
VTCGSARKPASPLFALAPDGGLRDNTPIFCERQGTPMMTILIIAAAWIGGAGLGV